MNGALRAEIAMTHDPVVLSPAPPPGLIRLWTRDPEHPDHWTMLAVGQPDDVHLAFADCGVHAPEIERLILGATESPCGPPKTCDLCWRPAVVGGRATGTGSLVLLCGRCFDHAKKRIQ